MHGLIFFFLQKFLLGTTTPDGSPSGGTVGRRTTAASPTATRYLPSGVYPDDGAVAMLQSVADTTGEPLGDVVERFGEFLAPHLFKVAGTTVDPTWKVLDLVEQTDRIIHSMIRIKNPGAKPPALETVRVDPQELHLVYASSRRLCRLARGLIRGMARHLGELVEIEETSCMLHGDPFCTFVIRTHRDDTGEHGVHEAETLSLIHI